VSSPSAGKFQDHYDVLGIKSDATTEVIQKAYGELAAKYNPRNAETGDAEKFDALNFAYETLLDPQQRKLFDSLRAGSGKEEIPQFTGRSFFVDVVTEVYLRQTILCILYDQRRRNPITPAVPIRTIDKMVHSTIESFELAIWYLKQRGLVVMDDKSRLLITVEGMDNVVQHPPDPSNIMNLLKATQAEPAPKAVTEQSPA